MQTVLAAQNKNANRHIVTEAKQNAQSQENSDESKIET